MVNQRTNHVPTAKVYPSNLANAADAAASARARVAAAACPGARPQRHGDGWRAPRGGRPHPRAHPVRDHAHSAAAAHGTALSLAYALGFILTHYTLVVEKEKTVGYILTNNTRIVFV